MKHEWRKAEKNLYGVKEKPLLLDVEKQQFIAIKGQGNPNEQDFSDRVAALYALAYAVKTAYKKSAKEAPHNRDITDFTVYPLEGLWSQAADADQNSLEKDRLFYTIMIRQPDMITQEMVSQALQQVRIKKPNPLYEDIFFETITDGLCIQILHIGAYDDEPRSFAKMDAFAESQGFKRSSNVHREIYLSNAQRTEKSKLKTILRYPIEKK